MFIGKSMKERNEETNVKQELAERMRQTMKRKKAE
jgi:hypothetical protein